MHIALLTTWNAVCGVSEYASFLVSAFEKQGHTVTIISTPFGGELHPIGCRTDGENVFRLFGTGFTGDTTFPVNEMLELLDKREVQVLIVSYQDYLFPNKPALNELVQRFTVGKRRSYILFHDTCYGPVEYGLFTSCVLPSTVFRHLPPKHRSISYIQQGIPEFEHLPEDRGQVRRDLCLPWPGAATAPTEGYLLSCFGLGRCKVQQLLEVCDYLNKYKLLPHNLNVFLSIIKPEQTEFAQQLVDKYDNVYISQGYLEAPKLAAQLHISDAVIIWYPEISHNATSSALRFAIGAKVPVLSNLSNWNKDMRGIGGWTEVSTENPESFKQAISQLFSPTYSFRRERTERLCQKAIDELGWSKIAAQWEKLWSK